MDARAATAVYTDFSSLGELKARAARDADGSLGEVARQFESLLLGQMLRSMRQASLGDGILDNDQSLFYREMFDQQLALQLAEHGGIGLAEAIERQLGAKSSGTTAPVKELEDYRQQVVRLAAIRSNRPDGALSVVGSGEVGPVSLQTLDPSTWNSDSFVRELWPWAQEAAGRLGLEPQALLAQAALETGWGRHVMRGPDGGISHNLFGIKADGRWSGSRVSVDTLEYEGDVALRKKAWFRAYESFRESFNDYVDFLQSSPRYEGALNATADSGSYFSELQRAGYATDPRYAEKIDAVLRGPEMSRALDRLKAPLVQPL